MDFEKLQNDFPQHEFFVVAELPAMFLIDLENNGTVEKSKNVKYFNLANKHFLVVFYNLYNILYNFIVVFLLDFKENIISLQTEN
jgi:hypothetical protein